MTMANGGQQRPAEEDGLLSSAGPTTTTTPPTSTGGGGGGAEPAEAVAEAGVGGLERGVGVDEGGRLAELGGGGAGVVAAAEDAGGEGGVGVGVAGRLGGVCAADPLPLVAGGGLALEVGLLVELVVGEGDGGRALLEVPVHPVLAGAVGLDLVRGLGAAQQHLEVLLVLARVGLGALEVPHPVAPAHLARVLRNQATASRSVVLTCSRSSLDDDRP
mmetsp:Transcript_837/g.2367  ORF Transcript_837/g.2367 Transcript_837/m.2367 type:complete len:217 (+) Transcript_837:160-810(+)